MRPRASALLVALLLAVFGLLGSSPAAALQPRMPAAAVPGIPTVGPLFLFTTVLPHFCSASVIASPHADLILTAGHCLAGTETGIQFAPGYDNGATPYGVWTVRRAYVDPAWAQRQDPQHDYAILQVDHQVRDGRWVGVQDVVGANVLGLAPQPGTTVTVDGYPFGSNDRPLTCTNTVRRFDGYPRFDCLDLAGGTSGGPWLVHTGDPRLTFTVGVIGGLHQGGCTDAVSYSSAFTWEVYVLWLRAVLGAPADFVPFPGPDGC